MKLSGGPLIISGGKWSRPLGGMGLAGTCSLGNSGARMSNSVCIVAGENRVRPQKATVGLRMVLSSRVGALGRGRGTDLTASAPTHTWSWGRCLVGSRVFRQGAVSSCIQRANLPRFR
jgi:hypothetical protein